MIGRFEKRTTRSARLTKLVALLGVLGVAGVGAFAAFGAPAVATPTITSGPSNPTNQTGATFAFSATGGVTGYQCSLDGSTFTACTSPKSYPGLAAGSRTFQVRAVKSGSTGSAVSYPWTIDLTAPKVSSIVRVGSSPTNAASVSWTVTFSESVAGVDPTDFVLVRGATPTGGPIAVSPAGSASVYTVSAPTGSGDGSLGLNLVDNDTIKDAATNTLAGASGANGSFTGPVYTVDKTGPASAPTVTGTIGLVASTSASFSFSTSETGVAGFQCSLDGGAFAACASPKSYSGLAQGGHTFSVRALDSLGNSGPASALRSWTADTTPPPAPVLTLKPPDPSSTSTSKFAWTDSESGVSFQCSIENGPWTACTSPFTFEVVVDSSNSGQHQFAVRAIDPAGNASAATTYKWKVEKGSGQDFTISGTVSNLQIGIAKTIPVTLTNPNNVPIYVTALNVTLSTNAGSGGCTASNFSIVQSNATAAAPITVPASSSLTLTSPPQAPRLTLINLPTNQDVCKNKSFVLTYSGSAHS